MADLVDHDHTSQTRHEAIAKVAGAVAARATAEGLVAGRLWQVDGPRLLAAAYAFTPACRGKRPPPPTSRPGGSRTGTGCWPASAARGRGGSVWRLDGPP